MELAVAGLRLRAPRAEDADEAWRMLQDPEVARWNPVPSVVDLSSARDWCVRGADWSDGSHATWHAVDGGTGRLAANCSVFAIDREHLSAKVGYRVAPWARGHGVATVVVASVGGWAFAELGLVRLEIQHAVANAASCRVAAKTGYVLEGTLRSASLDGHGVRQDDHLHGRVATDPTPPLTAREGRC
ncbi:MAG: GNAT family N-acetyltransferase [Actinomycetota bacterium]|nr:GNAT family N-acetyltransferase [Actinomycetota bacterium]MDH4353057.1 GNAT family N-acetyltransferase [Actinomycetota bacterium]